MQAGGKSHENLVAVTCPAAGCRVVSLVEVDEGVNGLPVAPSTVADPSSKPSSGAESAAMCENECGRNAMCECQACPAKLCDDCFAELHKSAVLRKHVRALLTAGASPVAAPSVAVPTKCSLHPAQDLLLACQHAGCRCLLCPVCSHGSAHKAHLADVLPLEDALQRVQRELSSASAALTPLLSQGEWLADELSVRLWSLDD